ncbi:putative metal-dependent hydrolase [Desmospora profundinema]|uniref:Metal-dependent hydrolase n=1 Tax=Desmospora profundinema TaxID=1571184 RepID=A0ABU1IMD3_9BACL|nr:putative metal-dependent hydrolase [Desmospora profundinema]
MSTGDGEKSPLFIRFLYHFNVDRDYYECHEVLEELWLEEGRDPLYQGLLQVAVALFHCRNGNLNGARKLFRQALDKLRNYPGESLGIDLARLRRKSEAYLADLERAGEAPFLFYDLDIEVVDPDLRKRLAELENQTPR